MQSINATTSFSHVENVSWKDVQIFIEKINKKADKYIYRLPTEAEWEYAARAGTKGPFAFGDCLSTNDANYDGDYPLNNCPKGKDRGKTIPVATLKANQWELYDMHGNVYEWCSDWYGAYPTNRVVDPQGAQTGDRRLPALRLLARLRQELPVSAPDQDPAWRSQLQCGRPPCCLP